MCVYIVLSVQCVSECFIDVGIIDANFNDTLNCVDYYDAYNTICYTVMLGYLV